MLTVLILVVFVVVALVLILLVIVVVAIRQEPRETEMRTVAPSLIAVRGPATARGLPAQAYSPSRQPQGVASRRVDRDDKPSVRRKEVRNRCRHTPSSK